MTSSKKNGVKTRFSNVIAIIALFAAAFNSYHTWLSPFQPELSIGTPMFVRVPLERDPKEFTVLAVLPINIVNKGARGGTIKDINIIVTAGAYEWILMADQFCAEFGQGCFKEGTAETFHPIFIAGNKELYRNIIFKPDVTPEFKQPPIFTDKEGLMPSGGYTLEFRMSYGSDFKLRPVKTIEFKLIEEHALKLSRGNFNILTPHEKNIQDERYSLEMELLRKK